MAADHKTHTLKNLVTSLKSGITAPWTMMRIVRLVLGGIMIGEAVHTGEWIFGGLGILLAAQAVVNYSSCTSGSCRRV
jgi:hypothetical protein